MPSDPLLARRWQEELVKRIADAYDLPTNMIQPARASSGWAGLRTALATMPPAVRKPMYGMVIKPTAANKDFPPETRQMVIMIDHEIVRALILNPEPFYGYNHLIENFWDRWELA